MMITALYNAALDNYKKLLEDTRGKPQARKEMVENFNKHFAGFAKIDEYGNVNPIEETYKFFANESFLKVVALTNKVIKGNADPKFIEKWLVEANKHCGNQYKAYFNNLIYKDTKQTIPFIMEKSLFGYGTLQQISLNIKFGTDLKTPIQSASNSKKLEDERSKIPDEEAIGDSQSHLKTAQTKLTELERYILKAKLEAKKELASKQKNQIDKVIESFNKARDSIADQIKDQPVDVQKYVLQNINPQLAKSVANKLPETNKMSLSEELPWLTIPEESEITLLDKQYAVLANEIERASKNLSKIREEDIPGEQLDNVLDKVNESELDASNLRKVIEQSKSYTQDDLAVDGLIFQQQLTNAKKILAEQIKDVEEKFESIKQANKEWLTTFERERQSLIDIESPFKEMEYQRNQSEKNKEALQRLTELAARSYKNILSEYQQINQRIKLAKEAQTVEQAVILETPPAPPEEPKEEIVTPPTDNVSKDQNENPPTTNKGALSRRKPESRIETKIREIYDKYFKQVKAETEKLSQKEPLQWQELFKEHKNQEGDLEDFKKEYIRDEKSKIKEEKAVSSLNEIIDLIEKTEWKIGKLGSKSKINIKGKETPVPNHIYQIYQKAKEGIEDSKKADEAMQEINQIATRAISYSDIFGFINKRDKQTQEAYEAIELHSKPR
ncbi:hypothetical protein OQJ26_06380 [Legionella sp. PATHC038]|uniref:hypothetical protein n=1 Tax=Legionella sheltonii TaxID=2992041 RepID=UPI002243590C|nr:hypothetical protein [Legionella sp. PATHC038]MCW8398416.1 hypothetical protein [Legionella sp. PATHC038]